MGFSAKQLQALRRNPDHRRIRTREANGRQLSYLEGWYAISEANRIFGFDGWSRETLETRCVLARENRGNFLAVYVARVRVTVQADGATVIREGHGSGEGRGTSPGEVHDIALKAAETDATKRALATFGKPFGLELYRGGKTACWSKARSIAQPALPDAQLRTGFHPDDTTPIPRPSTYYGRRHDPAADKVMKTEIAKPIGPPLVPTGPEAPAGRIDKSQLTFAEPKRLRDKAHLKFVASQPCLICARQPSDPHHFRLCAAARDRAERSAMSSPCRCAVHTIDSCIKLATRRPGGRISKSIRLKLRKGFGFRLIPKARRLKRRPQELPNSSDVKYALGG